LSLPWSLIAGMADPAVHKRSSKRARVHPAAPQEKKEVVPSVWQDQLPDVILRLCLDYCSSSALARVSTVCRGWRNLDIKGAL
jgi:hypothetical protein